MTLYPDANDAAMLDGLSAPDTPTPDAPMIEDGELQFPDPTPQDPAPEAQLDAAPAPAPPPQGNDWQQAVGELARRQMEFLDRQQQAPTPQPAAPAPWVDPAQREDWLNERMAVRERESYDQEAIRRGIQMDADAARERMEHYVLEQQAQLQNEMRLTTAAPQVQQAAFTEARAQYGDNLREGHWNAVVTEVFGGNPAAVAQALDPRYNPQAAQTRQMLADAAVGRALRAGELAPTPRPPAPPTVRSDARNPAPSRANNGQWQDNSYVDSIIGQAFENPFKFVKKGGNQ